MDIGSCEFKAVQGVGINTVDLQWHPRRRRTLGLSALPDGQVRSAIQPMNALVIHVGELRAQEVVDAPIVESPARLRNFDDGGTERRRLLVRLGRMAIAVSG